ncbi:unnamed protein product [Caenorhabditis bovis]|uniref:Cytochrome P450 n=1 Tax=Caenorhabditis bovis TaxID=2654633 RepID=A0A8S1ELX2_9PELO|nr:unnamed protein product [Caenorhabditis bovis]
MIAFWLILTGFAIFFASYFDFLRKLAVFYKYGERIPGPKAHPILGNVRLFQGKSPAELYDTFLNLCQEAMARGDNLIRFQICGKLSVWPLNGKCLAPILDSTTELDKGEEYGFLKPWLGEGVILLGYGEKLKARRKLLNPSFHFSKLHEFLNVFNDEAERLVRKLEKAADADATVDMFPVFQQTTLNIIGEAVMGIRMEANHEYANAIDGYLKMTMEYMHTPHMWSPILFWLLGYKKKRDALLTTMQTFTERVIAERMRELDAIGGLDECPTNFLDMLLRMRESNALTPREMAVEVDVFFFAGHDTTSISLSWSCWLLAHHRDVQQRVYEELERVCRDGCLRSETIARLAYLDRVLKESKRMFPPVPSVQRKLRSNLIIDGYVIPAEASVNISPMAVHRNPSIYSNPDKFDPDRFLPDAIARRHPYDYIPFSAGLRNCIGQKFAQIEEKVLIAHIVRNFEIVPMLGFEATKPGFEIVAKPSNGIPVRFVRRE